jgi:hypothetical protein
VCMWREQQQQQQKARAKSPTEISWGRRSEKDAKSRGSPKEVTRRFGVRCAQRGKYFVRHFHVPGEFVFCAKRAPAWGRDPLRSRQTHFFITFVSSSNFLSSLPPPP